MSAKAEQPRFSLAVIIACGCMIAMIAFGIRSTMGLFTAPVTETHGFSRETFALAMALQNLLWGMAQPFAGMLADKFGSARVVMAGALIYAAGLALMSVASTASLLYLSGGIMVGVGIATSSFSLIMAAFGRIVPPEKRSWAFGIATAASSFGQFVFAPLGQGFIAAFGWETALLLLAGITLFMLVLAIPLNTRPGAVSAAAAEVEMTMRDTLRQAFGHTSYILLILGFFVCGFHVAFITVHLPPYLVEKGVAPAIAAWSIGLVGLFNIFGSYMAGTWGGKYSKRAGLSFIYAARAVTIFMFIMFPITNVSALLFAAVMGLLWLSTVPLTMGLVTVMFGTRFMATLYGFVFLSHQLGSFLGVWLGGKFYDMYGNYDLIWWAGIALGIFAALVHLPIREQAAGEFAAGNN